MGGYATELMEMNESADVTPADREKDFKFPPSEMAMYIGEDGKWHPNKIPKEYRKSVTDEGYVPFPVSTIGRDWAEQKAKWKDTTPDKKGMKFSEGKPKWQYMKPLWPAMEEVVHVLTRGAEKYEENNWMHVDRDEYIRAVASHYVAYASGETIDPDMGSNHMANLICSALFLLWHDGIRREDDEENI